MPKINWNPDQLRAIESRNGTILVSAAAGSGKTAVLVERVMRKICEDNVGIEDMLIVTFTRAAAFQMKAKIAEKLNEKIAQDPTNQSLKRSLFMLPFANICTIDSFCINLVRENFHKLGIAPDFTILDAAPASILQHRALAEVTDKYHREHKEDYKILNDLINSEKNDDNISQIVTDLYNHSEAYVFPDEWLHDLYLKYTCADPLLKTPLGQKAIADAKKYIEKKLAEIENATKKLNDMVVRGAPLEGVIEEYLGLFSSDTIVFNNMLSYLDSGEWDTFSDYVSTLSYKANSRKSKGDHAKAVKDFCNSIRNYNTKGFFQKKFPYLFYSEQEHFNSIRETADYVNLLIQVVLDYRQKLFEFKQEENAYTFSDILHLTLNLLVEKGADGKPVKTEIAKELCKNFDEILVDEYQDVSDAQDTIFWALSRDDSNRFLVGDVKQSIYGFRQAMPEVFTGLRKNIREHSPEYAITLSSNYRSRKGVTNNANFIFENIMTANAGGVDYKDNEQLNPEADYGEREKNVTDFETYLIETPKGSELESQAKFVAQYVRKAIDEGMLVGKKGEERPCTASDFCILIRNTKNSTTEFIKAFEDSGIDLSVETKTSLLETPEVGFVVSLLKIIDNPLNDIPLITVLLSPVYGFTPDDLAKMRIEKRRGSIYDCLVKMSKSGDKKAADFLNSLKTLRRVAATLPAGEFTAKIIDETGYRAIVSAMPNGETKVLNLGLFVNLATKYETTGVKGVSGFVRFLTKLEDAEGKSSLDSKSSPKADAVKMMTIHKSKGLEFPVVFVVNCQKNYNEPEKKSSFVISRSYGLGIKWVKNNVRYKTLTFAAAADGNINENRSEELRLLYVALTRAKERTVIVGTISDADKKIKAEEITEENVLSKNNYLDCMLLALSKHPDAHQFREAAGIETSEHISGDIPPALFKIIDSSELNESDEAEAEPEKEEASAFDKALYDDIAKRLSYKYPYDPINATIVKRIASKFDSESFNENYFASARPAFANRGKLTPAQKGTATHRFMQFADYNNASKDVDAEKARLVENKQLTQLEADAVDSSAVSKFFESDLAKRILKAEKVYKEYPFTASMLLKDVEPDIINNVANLDPEKAKEVADSEEVIVEGVVDCAFVENGKLVILDYKTDRAHTPEELREKYSSQLTIYKNCLSQALNMDVSETVIYSFGLSQEIKL